jgi:hypothetical protein
MTALRNERHPSSDFHTLLSGCTHINYASTYVDEFQFQQARENAMTQLTIARIRYMLSVILRVTVVGGASTKRRTVYKLFA